MAKIISYLQVSSAYLTVDEDDLQEAAEQYYKKEEINMKEQLKKKAQKMLQENIIAPATSAIKDSWEVLWMVFWMKSVQTINPQNKVRKRQ